MVAGPRALRFVRPLAPTLLLLAAGAQLMTATAAEGLQGAYFRNKTLAGDPSLTRTDATVAFDWGTGAPAKNIPADLFSVRWTGSITAPTSETYTIRVTGDDGVRLWLDGRLVIDQWHDTAAQTYAVDVPMTAGAAVPVVLEYYENGGYAVAGLSWSTASQAATPIPASALTPGPLLAVPPKGTGTGILGQYFPTIALSGTAVTRKDAAINFDWADTAPVTGIPVDGFSVRWLGTVTPTVSDTVRFVASTDDGIRLWLDDQLLIDGWYDKSVADLVSPPVTLVAGEKHRLRMEFYENGGLAVARLAWYGSTFRQQVVPKDVLLPANAPVSKAGSLFLEQDTAATGSLVATDADGDQLTYAIATPPTKGTVALDAATGAYTYTPNAGVIGSDSFTFTASDGFQQTKAAKVSVTIKNTAAWLTDPRSGIVAWWKFDDGSGSQAVDSTGKGHTAVITPGDSIWHRQNSGGLIEQVGQGGPTAADAADLRFSDGFAISAWINPARALSAMPGSFPSIVWKHDWANNAGFLFGSLRAGENSLGLRILTGASAAERQEVDYPETAVATWVHLVGQYDGRFLSIYRNGQLAVQQDIGAVAMNSSGVPVILGGDQFQGLLDDVRLYNHGLSASEIAVLATQKPANAKPDVDAGSPVGLLLPRLDGQVSGSARDVDSAKLTARWTVVGGDTSVSFAKPTNYTTAVAFSAPGTYVLRLTVSDGKTTGFADTRAVVYESGHFAAGEVLRYDFSSWDGAGPVEDASGHGHAGLPINATLSAGRRGQGAAFAGQGDISTPDADDLRLQTYSITGWMKPANPFGSTAYAYPSLVQKQSWWGNAGYALYSFRPGLLGMRVFAGTDQSQRAEIDYAEQTSGAWVHVAGTYDGQQLRVWQNGRTVAQGAGPGQAINHDATWLSVGIGFEGVLDEIRIHDHALDETEIKALAGQLPSNDG